MGRKKLRILRLECTKARQLKYSKRKVGILNKARELATLCDVDLLLLIELSTVLERLSNLTVEEQEQRCGGRFFYSLSFLKLIPFSQPPDIGLKEQIRVILNHTVDRVTLGKLWERKRKMR
ncbi:hypothetical protein P3X46_008898 [Hevea brasiliensis]|uniref:MADS-box domain-containing protein n=1 Tax=Hevea brasiliensis TaxID=3981 RepID=A0ABQ9MNY9_HEVBR|nr:hypothetical protein P3X46_008898 [Hevea brasiliensis]